MAEPDCHPSAKELAKTAWVAAVVLVVAFVAFYGVGVATGEKLFFTHEVAGSDTWHNNHPSKHFYAEELAQGRLPLWCSRIGTGFPLAAASEVGALYPIHLVLFRLLPFPVAMNWSILSSVLLAGVFAAMYARQLGAARSAAVFVATTFGVCGFFVTHIKHPAMLASAAWAPLFLLALERHGKSRSWRSLAVLVVAVAMTAFGGHPQMVYNSLFIGGIYAIYLMVRMWRGGEPGSRGALGFGARSLYAVALGLLLAAPQILPTMELNSVGPRQGGMTFEELDDNEFRWKYFVTFVAPNFYGKPGELKPEPAFRRDNGQPLLHPMTGKQLDRLEGYPLYESFYWEITGYVGLLALFLALGMIGYGALRRRHGDPVLPLSAFLVFVVLLMMGTSGGLFYLCYYAVPGFDQLRFHTRFMLFADLWLAVLAGLGLTMLLRRFAKDRAGVAFVVAGLVIVIGFFDSKNALGDHNPQVESSVWLEPPNTADVILQREKDSVVRPRLNCTDGQFDVFKSAYFQAKGWSGDLEPYRAAQRLLDPNLASIYGLNHLGIVAPIYPIWSRLVAGASYTQDQQNNLVGIYEKVNSLYNVGYVLDPFAKLPKDWETLGTFEGGVFQQGSVLYGLRPFKIRVAANPKVLPRAFLVPEARYIDDGEEAAFMELLAPDFDPRREVLILREPDQARSTTRAKVAPIDARVEIVSYEPRRVVLKADAPRDCWLFLSDTWYPGWEARVDGSDVPILRANAAGRAVKLGAGPHHVEFRYAPTSFTNGLWLALVGLVLLLTLPLQARWIRKWLSRSTDEPA